MSYKSRVAKGGLSLAGPVGLFAVWWGLDHEMVVRHISDPNRLDSDSL